MKNIFINVKVVALAVLTVFILISAVPVSAELPDLIPMNALFGGGAKGLPKISPNGKFLAYLSPSENGVVNIWIKTPGKDDHRMVTGSDKRSLYGYMWAMNSRHVIYLQDSDGDENFHIYATDIDTKTTRDLTPFKGAKAQNILVDPAHPDAILAAVNVRDKRFFDMYRIDLPTGKSVKVAENPGDVRWWLADTDFVVRAAVAIDAKTADVTLRVRDAADKPWRNLILWPFGETGLLEGYGSDIAIAFTRDNNAIYVQAAFSGDIPQLAKVDARTGKVLEIVASDPKACIWSRMDMTLYDKPVVLFHPKTREVQAVGFYYLKPKWKALTSDFKKDFEILSRKHQGVFKIESRDLEDKMWTVKYMSDSGSGAFYLYDRGKKKLNFLYETAAHLKKFKLAEMKPVVIKARDGWDIPGYLMLPVGVPAKNLPLLVTPHGGPWARDEWGFDEIGQIFVNRGYAVLKPNFRGSAGFGKKHLNAGIGQWGVGVMQHDITDAVKWAIKEGIADPKRIGIMGGSYGGYAVLAGLTFTPDLYTCGVDLFGISDVRTFLDTMPAWWEIIKTRWIRRIDGNILTDEAVNRRISPLFHADKIKAKLLILHGANDPRVAISESYQIVKTMRKHKRDVTFTVYPDEGHGFGKPANLADALMRVEAFLAKHLGGRTLPWKDVPGTSAQVK